METTTDTGCIIMLLDRASCQLQNTIVPHSHHHWLYIFASDKQEPACCARKNLHQWRRPTFSQLRWRHHCQENVTRIIHLSLAWIHGSQKAPNPDHMVGVVGQSSQTLKCAAWSSNWYGAWHYHVAGKRLSSSLAWLEIRAFSLVSVMM
jgi:hypothetical protein